MSLICCFVKLFSDQLLQFMYSTCNAYIVWRNVFVTDIMKDKDNSNRTVCVTFILNTWGCFVQSKILFLRQYMYMSKVVLSHVCQIIAASDGNKWYWQGTTYWSLWECYLNIASGQHGVYCRPWYNVCIILQVGDVNGDILF